MANISGEFSVVHYFDAEKNDLMFVRFWVNGHEVLMPLSELVYGLKDGKEIEAVIPEDTSEENKLVNMNEVLEAIGRLQEETTLAVANRKAVEAARKKAKEESKKNLPEKDAEEIEGEEPNTDTEETKDFDKVSETKKLNKEQEADDV